MVVPVNTSKNFTATSADHHLRKAVCATVHPLFTAGCCTVCEKLCTVFFTSKPYTDAVFCHGDGAVSDKPIKSEGRNVQYILRQ